MYRIKQRDSTDCAVASLLSIIKYYKGNISYLKLRNIMKCNNDGVSAYDLISAAKRVGLKGEGIKCSYLDLINIKTPFIAHVTLKETYDHYVVVENIDKYIKVNDPYLGIKKYNRVQFEKIWNNIIIVLEPFKTIVNENNHNRFYINLLLKYKKEIIVLIIISLISIILSIISTYYFKMLLDNVLTIKKIFIVFSILLIGRLLLDYIRNIIMMYVEKKIDIDIMLNSYNNMLSLQEDYFISRQNGDILSRFDGLDSIKSLIFKIPFLFFMYLVISIISSLILINISIKMYIISLILIITYFVSQLLFFKKNKYYIKKINEEKGYFKGYLSESIDGIKTIRNYNIQNNKYNIFKSIYEQYISIKIKYNRLFNLEDIFKNMILLLSFNYILYMGISILDTSNLILFYMVLSMLIDSIKNIFEMEEEFSNGLVSINRFEELISVNINNGYYSNVIDNIYIDNISYAYKNDHNIINNFSYELNSKDKLLVSGCSGSGKTTLFYLLLRYMEIDKGNIFIGKENINNWNIKGIRDNITYVNINDKIFRGSLIDNICFNDYNKDKLNNIVNICKLNIDLNIIIDENGTNISLGEKSKLLLCRALYKSSRVIIIDELLSNIDIDEENIIVNNIVSEFKDRIIIYTNHRNINECLFNKIIKLKERGEYEILK